jgi:hypothetical protein
LADLQAYYSSGSRVILVSSSTSTAQFRCQSYWRWYILERVNMPAILKIIELAHTCRYLSNVEVQWCLVPFFRISDLRSTLLTEVFSSLPCVTSWAGSESWPQPLPSTFPIPSSSHEALPHCDARYVIPDRPFSSAGLLVAVLLFCREVFVLMFVHRSVGLLLFRIRSCAGARSTQELASVHTSQQLPSYFPI